MHTVCAQVGLEINLERWSTAVQALMLLTGPMAFKSVPSPDQESCVYTDCYSETVSSRKPMGLLLDCVCSNNN